MDVVRSVVCVLSVAEVAAPPFDFILRRNAAQSVPDLERESQTLGRSFGLHSVDSQRPNVPGRS
jgi:hypothetical protein